MILKFKFKNSVENTLQINDFSVQMIKKILQENTYKVVDDILEVRLYEEKCDLLKVDKKIEIIYEDEYLLIINKPSVHECSSGRRYYEDNLSNYIAAYYQKKHIHSTIHLVNRLDYKTEGLIIVAKHGYIHHLFRNIKVLKKYLLITDNTFSNNRGFINIKILKEDGKIKRIISSKGKNSLTEYKIIKNYDNKSLVEAILHTGRTHQIRLSFASINHSLVGDQMYGNYQENNKLCLCAYYLKFNHPINHQELIFQIKPSFLK